MSLQTPANGFCRTGHPVRRRHLRIPCHVPAQLQHADQRVCGFVSDLSLGGMLFVGPAVALGERVSLTLELASAGQIRLAGEVLDHRTHAGDTRTAIRFPLLSQSDLKAINRFVASQIA